MAVHSVEDLPAVLRAADVQAYLGLSRPTTYKLMSQRGFPCIRIGAALRVTKEGFLRWLDQESASGPGDGEAA